MATCRSSRREFIKSLGLGLGSLTLGASIPGIRCTPEARQPNFIIIFIDDMGYADIGSFGARGFRTPNLDRMAAEGMRFSDFYVSQAVCSASRASLLTGCYAERVGIQGALTSWSRIGLNPAEATIADVLRQRGYTSAIVGKWHLGHQIEFLPLQQGFDEYFGLPYSNDMWPVDFDGTPITGGRKSAYPPLPLIDGNDKVTEIAILADQATLTTRYTERALEFITKNKTRPFFLYLAQSMVHVPLAVSEKFRGLSAQGLYGDVVMEIDWSVGQILAALERLGLDHKTLVIFTSDNGPWLNFGNHAGSAGALREGKGTMWEGGARVPCLMRWPGQIPANSNCAKIAATIDILPTLAGLADAPLPEKKIDGIDIWPLLAGATDANPRDHYFYYYDHELRAVRQDRWKLVFLHQYRSYQGVQPGKDGYPGPYNTATCGLELYDLQADPGETKNLAAEHPDLVVRLQGLAQQMREALGDRLTQTPGTENRPPGRIGQNKMRTVHHLAVNKPVQLRYPYQQKYAAGGANALVDGQRGSDDYADGCWQGFEGVDLEATIDLGTVMPLRRVTCGFLQDQSSWIFFPTEVIISSSENGTRFQVIKLFQEPILQNFIPATKDYRAEIAGLEARFVRVLARTVGTCPAWHPGAGGKAWVFADEIVVE